MIITRRIFMLWGWMDGMRRCGWGGVTLLNGAVDRRALKEAVAWAEGNRGFLEETWNDYQAG